MADARQQPAHLAPDTALDTLETGLARDRFPLLARRVGDQPLRYLDTAATSQKPLAVLQALEDYYRRSNANVHRGLNTLAAESTAAYENCRQRVAGFVGLEDPRGVVITRGATSALNLVARGLVHRLQPGDEIILSEMEHHANLVPWQMIAREHGLVLRFVPVRDDGTLDREAYRELLGARTRVVSLVHVSNVLGTVNPLAEFAAEAHAAGALVVADAAQTAGHLPLDVAQLGADFAVFSAHKAYGPMGLGFLLSTPDRLADLEPYEGGGEMIEWVHLDHTTWAEIPHRFEAGTPNVAAAAAFPAALDLLAELGAEAIRRHEEAVTQYALERLRDLGGLTIYGPGRAAQRGGLVAFWDPDVHPHDLSTILDQSGVAVRAGHHCAQPLHRRLGVPATTRASFGLYNRRDDIDALIEGIVAARKLFAP